jgi:hypothetical protein
VKLRRDVSDDYRKQVRQMIRDPKQVLDQIQEDFDARRGAERQLVTAARRVPTRR